MDHIKGCKLKNENKELTTNGNPVAPEILIAIEEEIRKELMYANELTPRIEELSRKAIEESLDKELASHGKVTKEFVAKIGSQISRAIRRGSEETSSKDSILRVLSSEFKKAEAKAKSRKYNFDVDVKLIFDMLRNMGIAFALLAVTYALYSDWKLSLNSPFLQVAFVTFMAVIGITLNVVNVFSYIGQNKGFSQKPLTYFLGIIVVIGSIVLATVASHNFSTNHKNLGGEEVIAEVTSIYDGDTFKANISDYPAIIGKHISVRVNGIDTPKLHGKCDKEKQLAIKAKQFTVEQLRAAKSITLKNIKRGKYFRLIADVYVDGVSLSEQLVKNGHAVTYKGNAKKNWC